MAATLLLPASSARQYDVDTLLIGDSLGIAFHRLFDITSTDIVTSQDKSKAKLKQKKKATANSRDKSKKLRDKGSEKIAESSPVPNIELVSNPSSFAVYASIRHAVLKSLMQQVNSSLQQAAEGSVDSDSDEDNGLKSSTDSIIRLPKIVGVGLCSVFELIRETQTLHPLLCIRSLQALFDILQGQLPEGLRGEPAETIDSLYQLLMELAQSRGGLLSAPSSASLAAKSSVEPDSESLSALACSCLLSLVIACGDSGKLLTAIAAMLMFSARLAKQEIKIPRCLTLLQSSVQAVLVGHVQIPEWLTHGIPQKSCVTSARVSLDLHLLQHVADAGSISLASNGRFVFLHSPGCGLVKIGSGYGNTIIGHVYGTNSSFFSCERGRLMVVKNRLLFKSLSDSSGALIVVNTDTLLPVDEISLEGKGFDANAMFADGDSVGYVASSRDVLQDCFVVRTYNPFNEPSPVLVSELPLKLARKCLDVFGLSTFDFGDSAQSVIEEDCVSIQAGKEFALMQTSGGKVLYAGKPQALGLKSSQPANPTGAGSQSSVATSAANRWTELPIVKSPKIIQYSVGHEGSHCLLVADDGSVFFVGVAKRGEDGDAGSLSKARRQMKAVKPKKMIRVEGKLVVSTACNSGTSALVTQEGELYMFGKDTLYCDHVTGLLSDMKGITVTSVALGKAHGLIQTNTGHIYTFGLNNKGQCGREFSAAATKEAVFQIVTMADEEEFEDEVICPLGKHQWVQRECMICTICEECTGYGSSCINSGSHEDRVPGQCCGCGSGDAGCAECGACRTCAGEVVGPAAGALGIANGIYVVDELMPMQEPVAGINLAPVRQIANRDGESRRSRNKPKALQSARKVEASAANSDHELDHMKLASLAPGRVDLDGVAVHIACGLHHSVILMDNGEVYTFGSNQYGQLGVGDTVVRGVPTRVAGIKTSLRVKQVAAGSNHTVLMTADGQVYTCGNNQRGQLGRPTDEDTDKSGDAKTTSSLLPGPIPGIGAKHARRAAWIGASADQTFVRIDESLINVHTLTRSNIIANSTSIGIVPTVDIGRLSIQCLMIRRADGSCRSFSSSEQLSLIGHSVCLDPVYNNLWSYNPTTNEIAYYSVVAANSRSLKPIGCNILSPELAMPVQYGYQCPRSHCAVNLLGCLDTLTAAYSQGLMVSTGDHERQAVVSSFMKEDYLTVNRFESYGGGWGYSGHSIEAIRFSCDTDVLLGGFGLFGGRGEYCANIKVFELGADTGDNELDGELLAETDDMPYRCSPREKFAMLFDEPVPIQANVWYVAWARISGPSSDCGSSGLTTVTADDQIVFKFKNSKKSNNGTDTNAGQIPQLFYRLPTSDSSASGLSSNRKKSSEQSESVHVLSTDFSRSVTPECFESLLSLLSWSWSTFCMLGSELSSVRGDLNQRAALLDLKQLVYISSASLRLIRVYVCEVYPASGNRGRKSSNSEIPRLAECIGEARLLLRQILSESSRYQALSSSNKPPESAVRGANDEHSFDVLREHILNECQNTFIGCFHAFYPTPNLKWMCLCELLASSETSRDIANIGDGSGRLLTAILEALCQMTTKLNDIIPVGSTSETPRGSNTGPITSGSDVRFRSEQRNDDAGSSGNDNKRGVSNKSSNGSLQDGVQFPVLVGHMLHQTEMELVGRCHFWTLRDVLDRLLVIAGVSVRHSLGQEKSLLSSRLVYNACRLLSILVLELSQSAAGVEVPVVLSGRPLLTTPNRFGRLSQGAFWNSGNGNPDAVCFTVDRPGIVIAGVGIYGGGGNYEYELELLEDMDHSNDPNPNGRWNTLELVKGTYGQADCVNDIADIKFDKSVPIKENVKYAIRLRNRGPRTRNGDYGTAKVKCADGTSFTFSSCTLSSNGTNHSRGQIPTILYYSSSHESQPIVENSQSVATKQARKTMVMVVESIFKTGADLLEQAQDSGDVNMISAFRDAPLFSMLMPTVCAYISPVVPADPYIAVQMLEMIQEILPAVTSLCIEQHRSSVADGADLKSKIYNVEPARHYAVVESDHPYKSASVNNYRVKFPSAVNWLTVHFDARCGTAQPEDSLQLYIPARSFATRSELQPTDAANDNAVTCETLDSVGAWWPVQKKYSGTGDSWPTMSIVLPGSEVCFSLETASDYLKDEKACFYGFRCTVIGYEWPSVTEQDLALLQHELAGLGGACAASLMKKDIALPNATADDCDDVLGLEASVKHEFTNHTSVLSRGLSLLRSPSVLEALDGNLPLSETSSERAFLYDFIDCAAETCGGRLAAWLQPESYIDPKQCSIQPVVEELHCSVPTSLTIVTRDQYENPVHAPKLKVQVTAMPIAKDMSEERNSINKQGKNDDASLLFGGHPHPRLDVPYHVTVKDNRDSYHAICIMKVYENYSFEELRYATPVTKRPSENMLIRDNADGTYSATWTPASIGLYLIQIKFDGYDAGEPLKVEVHEAPHSLVTPPNPQHVFGSQTSRNTKLRKFVASDSAGLRVRVHPSLQSEQIGIIKPGGVISFTDETHNDDGVWLRLSSESIREFCSPLNGCTEGWALQYNQHRGKTLLVPVEDTRSLVADRPKDTNPLQSTMPSGRNKLQPAVSVNKFPGVFIAVKCGASGHNIRVAPSLDATAIGMVVVGNQLTATCQVPMCDGVWVQLDKASTQSYCHDTNGDAWCLASSVSGEVFLRSQLEMEAAANAAAATEPSVGLSGQTSALFGADVSAMPPPKGFDFTMAAKTPVFSAFSSVAPIGLFGSTDDGHMTNGPFTANGEVDVVIPECNGTVHVPNAVSVGDVSVSVDQLSQRAAAAAAAAAAGRSVADPLGKARSASLKRESTPYSVMMSPASKSIVSPLIAVGVGVGVGVGGGSGGGSCEQLSASVPVSIPRAAAGVVSCADVQHRIAMHIPDLPPELQGVSFKDLVKALGESRVNGNGVTPPRTPPGTPKKTASRSSSPRTPISTSDSFSTRENVARDRSPSLVTAQSDAVATAESAAVTPATPAAVLASSSPSIGSAVPVSSSSTPNVLLTSVNCRPTSGGADTVGQQQVASSPDAVKKSTVRSSSRSVSSSPQRSDPVLSCVISSRAMSASPVRGDQSSTAAVVKGVTNSVLANDCFRVGASPRKESPKTVRKERSRMLRSKRGGSPNKSLHHNHQTTAASSKSPLHDASSPAANTLRPTTEPVRQALSPSVALCMRSVFASFLWHEGIVHDAMAGASFLKFNLSLLKDPLRQKQRTLDIAAAAGARTNGPSPDYAVTDGKMNTKTDSDAGNINEAVRRRAASRHGQLSVDIASLSREHQLLLAESPATAAAADSVNEATTTPSSAVSDAHQSLPETLRYLVLFWDELSKVTSKVIEQNLISPIMETSSTSASASNTLEKVTTGKGKASAKKSKDGKAVPAAAAAGAGAAAAAAAAAAVPAQLPLLRGNLFGAAAGRLFPHGAAAVVEGGDKEVPCELCGGTFAHPVTYHMRHAHPGCGRPAGGQGYNSGGNFCGGWAGNCGDGGLGGSTWYLMCEKCRLRYLAEKRKTSAAGGGSGKDKSKKAVQTTLLDRKRPTLTPVALEPDNVIRSNALFILSLANSVGSPQLMMQSSIETDVSSYLPVVCENNSSVTDIAGAAGLARNALPFVYLELCGSQNKDSMMSDGGETQTHSSAQSATGSSAQLDRSISECTRMPRSRPLSTYFTANGKVDNCTDQYAAGAHSAKTAFQRSISDTESIRAAVYPEAITGRTSHDGGGSSASSGRRRNSSLGDSEGISLLKKPSMDMCRLIRSTETIAHQPIVSFLMQRHNLDALRQVMIHAARRATSRTYAMNALNWLIRHVTYPGCLHHLLWNFVCAVNAANSHDDDVGGGDQNVDAASSELEDVAICNHPLTDVVVAGEAATQPLVDAFHAFLQTVADMMMHVPAGSALQCIAVRCWSVRFHPSDHMFLHHSHVFSNISQILSRSDGSVGVNVDDGSSSSVAAAAAADDALVECLHDFTSQTDIRASSRQAMVGGMTDGSTETFWESGDEDKNKHKVLTVTCNFLANNASTRLRVVSLHVDNARDLGNKVSSITFSAGQSAENLHSLRHVVVDQRHAGWVSAWVSNADAKFVRIELKGPDNSLRVRQLKVLGEVPNTSLSSSSNGGSCSSSRAVQLRECETETLSVFRLLTSLVFGHLLSDLVESSPEITSKLQSSASDVDLKEHMVGILFSCSGELTKLQRQVCSHIVGAIRRETARVRAAWESASSKTATSGGDSSAAAGVSSSDAYCFELLSLVLALSGSTVGRRYVAQQVALIEDLITLLHAASPRVQRQIIALLRRILPDITPRCLSSVLGVGNVQSVDLGSIIHSVEPPNRRFLLDVFLACIAKALSVQVKSKLPGTKAVTSSVSISDCCKNVSADQWWLRGCVTTQLAETMISLLTDMTAGKFGSDWAAVSKVAIATPIIALSRLPAGSRVVEECIRCPTLWLALAALCVLNEEHVDRLSTGRWSTASAGADGRLPSSTSSSRPTCSNHDDDETPATILCTSGCGSLCAECDRILHLNKRNRLHQRQVFKEEEESIRVDLHEGCGRIKLYWLLALADSKTLKAIVEFRQQLSVGAAVADGKGQVGFAFSTMTSRLNSREQDQCRFCGAPAQADILLPVAAVCSQPECMEYARNACSRVLPCGHVCGGIRDEVQCLPCLHGCPMSDENYGSGGGGGSETKVVLRQDADDMCMICFADALSAAPVILLECGHAFHAHCCRSVLERRWPGPRITFSFMLCPICKRDISHPSLESLLAPARARRDDVRRKALMRLEYEGVVKHDGVHGGSSGGSQSEAELARYAMDRYAYYVCHKCNKAYYGGEARCEQQAAAAASEDYDPSELVCGACSDVTRAQMCARHGADFLEYKCRYCCSVAVFFCFGTTHFCGACHDDFQRVTAIPRTELPRCPAGPRAVQLTGDECPLHVQHPVTGEEFALGCGICRNAHTF